MSEGLKQRTAKGLLWGAINNLTSQLLMALIGIILGRLLTPADYGMVGMLAIFSAIAGSLQESGFTAALTNLKEATHKEYNAVFWASTAISFLLYLVLYFSAPLIASYFHQPELISLSRLVFASLLLAGIGVAHAAYMFRNMMNREKAITGFFALVGSGIVGITLALNGYSYWSLAWQQFAYICIINIGRLYFVRWLPTLHIDFTPIREMIGFSSKILITNIINQVNNNILSFIFGRLFAAGAVGNYTQAAKWNTMGHSLISGTMQQVAQPVLSSINEEENRQLNVFRKMLRFTALLSMPAMLGLAFIADFIVVLLGEQWADSVTLLRLLCISGAFLPIHTLYQNLFISHGRSDTYMWCTIALVITQIVVVMVFASWGIEVMIAAYVATLVLWTGVWQVLTYRLIKFRFLDLLKDVCPFLLATLASIAVAYYATLAISNTIGLILSRIVITSLLYVAIMKIAHVKIFQECIQFLFKHHETNH
jgi:O-antigen/teichoic acid export membrane protein